MRVVCLAFLAVALLAGCGAFFAPDRNVKEPLGERDVLGTWEITTNSLKLLRREGYNPNATNGYQLTFGTHGVCRIQTVHTFAGGFQYVDAAGTWDLEHNSLGDSNIRKRNTLHIQFSSEGTTCGVYQNFAREGGEIILWNYYGDPDLGEFIEYRRQK